MEQTQLEPTNAADRSIFADSYSDLGEAYSLLAMKKSIDSQERQTACEMYRRSLEIWQDLQAKGILPTDSLEKIETLSSQIAACKMNTMRK
jgi:hypothetical protein